MKYLKRFIIVAVIMVMLFPVPVSASTKSYAEEMMKALESSQIVIIKPVSKNKDGSYKARVYVYSRHGKKTTLEKRFDAVIGKYVKWSRTKIYHLSYGKDVPVLDYMSEFNGLPNKCRATYYTSIGKNTWVSSYIQYKESKSSSFRYPKKWKTDTTGLRNCSVIAMSVSDIQYLFSQKNMVVVFK